MDLSNFLTHKVGPFPTWLWLAVGAGGWYLMTLGGHAASKSKG